MLVELAVAAVGVAIGVAVLKRPQPVAAEPMNSGVRMKLSPPRKRYLRCVELVSTAFALMIW